MAVSIRTRYDYTELAKDREDIAFSPTDPLARSKTLQADFKASDINEIMRQFERTGLIPEGRTAPRFGDFSDIGDYHAMQIRLATLNERFLQLPADIRNEFGNDPAKMLDFLADPANDPRAVELGLKDASVLPPPAPPIDVAAPTGAVAGLSAPGESPPTGEQNRTPDGRFA